jgi:signal peptide peptidase SppA
MLWQPSRLQPWAERPWPIEPRSLAALVTEGVGHEGLEPPAAGPRLATKVRGDVAIVPLEGVVMPWKAEAFAGAVTAAMADSTVGAVVLAIDSPGGVITGVPEAADEIFATRGVKPIYAVSTGLMASAAYWLGSAADRVIASPSAYVGSIGVWTMHADLSKLLEEMGVKVSLISAGKYKVEGNWFESLSDEARAALQEDVNDAYASFLGAVGRHRGVSATEVRNGYGEGRVLNADRAKAAGLIDKIGTLGAVVGQLVGTPKGPPGRSASALRRRLDLDAAG